MKSILYDFNEQNFDSSNNNRSIQFKNFKFYNVFMGQFVILRFYSLLESLLLFEISYNWMPDYLSRRYGTSMLTEDKKRYNFKF